MKYLLIAMIIAPSIALAPTYKLSDNMEVEVLGTSTLHDWEMVSKEGSGSADFTLDGLQLKSIDALVFKLKTNTLKSGKNPMDNIAYDAMKEEKFPDISYVLKKVNSIKQSGSAYNIDAVGDLTIAGTTKPINMNVKAMVTQGKVQFTGSYTLKMTDYNVDPPTAMFGTIRTGDEITVKFNVDYIGSGSL